MKIKIESRWIAALALACAFSVHAEDTNWAPLKLKLPAAVFSGTPKAAPRDVTVELQGAQPPVVLVPPNVQNLAPKAKVTSSDKNATPAKLAKLTDGNKEAEEDNVILLHKGLQWVQFDLGKPEELFAVVIWHAHDTPKIYRCVIAQVADDEDFTENVRTLFNNDVENSSGLGVGADRQYFETYQGKMIPANKAKARYIRLYSHGSTDSALNEYTEVEIYGRDPTAPVH